VAINTTERVCILLVPRVSTWGPLMVAQWLSVPSYSMVEKSYVYNMVSGIIGLLTITIFAGASLMWLRFFRAFSSFVRQIPGYNSQRLGTANALPNLLFVLLCFLFVLFCC
jgi:hypothetical protein